MSQIIKKSLLAPKSFPKLPNILGVNLYSMHAGIRKKNKLDTMLILISNTANVACVVTNSKTPSAPVMWCKKIRNIGKASALLVNSGNANAHTGKEGIETVKNTVNAISKLFNFSKKEIYVCSTGVIGEKLDSKIITDAILKLDIKKNNSWKEIAESICTTDTFAKGAVSYFQYGGKKYKIIGIAKGSGMIYPNMGTMLSFIFTDFPLEKRLLSDLFKQSIEVSFNSITVDGDTSTSDTCILFSVPKKNNVKLVSNKNDKSVQKFTKALDKVSINLAKQIVADGEGAKKIISIKIKSAKTYKDAKTIALSIANSPLVKTAVAGEDPNWGRIIMAIGKSPVNIKQDLLSIKICGEKITKNGSLVKNYNEKVVATKMKSKEISIVVDLGIGNMEATVWTCDLTHDYISINADYRS